MGLIEQVFKYTRIKRSGLTGAVADDLDELSSEFPALTLGQGLYLGSGLGSISAASLSFTVPSGKLFHLKNIDFAFNIAPALPVVLYDGPGVSAPKFFFGWSATGVVQHWTDIKGVVFQSIPTMGHSISATAGFVRIGGLIRERGTEA